MNKPKKTEEVKEVIVQKIIIEDNSKAVELTLDQLRETRTFADAFGNMPEKFLKEHHIFIKDIMDMAEGVGAKPSIGQILAPSKGIEKISLAEAEEKGLDQDLAENTCVKVVIGRIDLGDKFAKKLWNLAIGFMYNEKGMEICVGTNIAICSNLTIFGEGVHYKSHGRGAISISEMYVNVKTWLENLEGFDTVNSELLERMIAIPIDWDKGTESFVGHCLKAAVRRNYHKGNAFPLNMTEVGRMTSYLIGQEGTEDAENPSLYHLYNAGTWLLTHSDDLPNKYGTIKEFTEWFEKEWLIPAEEVAALAVIEEPFKDEVENDEGLANVPDNIVDDTGFPLEDDGNGE